MHDTSARGLASRSDAAFVRELHKRVSAAAVGHFVTNVWLLKPARSLKAVKRMCAEQAAQQHVQPRPLSSSLFRYFRLAACLHTVDQVQPSVACHQASLRLYRSGLTKTARAQSRRLHLFKLATAAVAGVFTLQVLRGHQGDPKTACVQQV